MINLQKIIFYLLIFWKRDANKRLFESYCITGWFLWMSISIRSGQGQFDSIKQLIQLTAILLSGGHCIKSKTIKIQIFLKLNLQHFFTYIFHILNWIKNKKNVFGIKFITWRRKKFLGIYHLGLNKSIQYSSTQTKFPFNLYFWKK